MAGFVQVERAVNNLANLLKEKIELFVEFVVDTVAVVVSAEVLLVLVMLLRVT